MSDIVTYYVVDKAFNLASLGYQNPRDTYLSLIRSTFNIIIVNASNNERCPIILKSEGASVA